MDSETNNPGPVKATLPKVNFYQVVEDASHAAPELTPVRDPQLAEVLAAFAEHYERQNECGRRRFVREVKTHWPGLFRAPLDRVILWLGWGPAGPGGPKER